MHAAVAVDHRIKKNPRQFNSQIVVPRQEALDELDLAIGMQSARDPRVAPHDAGGAVSPYRVLERFDVLLLRWPPRRAGIVVHRDRNLPFASAQGDDDAIKGSREGARSSPVTSLSIKVIALNRHRASYRRNKLWRIVFHHQ